VFTPRRLPKICGQQKSRVQMDELPFWQPLPHRSVAWYDSFNRRNRIERTFGNVKNDAAQNVTRGRFRVMGVARLSLMTLFIVMAANLRLAQTFLARQEKFAADAAREAAGHVRQRRQPRMHNRLRAEMGARITAQKELAAVGDARAAGPPGPQPTAPGAAPPHRTPPAHLTPRPARKRPPGRATCPRSAPRSAIAYAGGPGIRRSTRKAPADPFLSPTGPSCR
jgi:hypothetical protein